MDQQKVTELLIKMFYNHLETNKPSLDTTFRQMVSDIKDMILKEMSTCNNEDELATLASVVAKAQIILNSDKHLSTQ
jgi:hypothetical protein